MLAALLRYPRRLRRAKAREWALRSVASRVRARMERPVEADTLRRRALDDRRGKVIREGCIMRSAGLLGMVVSWQICHSRHGRTNQVDCLFGGQLIRTCSLRTAARLLRQPLRLRASA